MIFQEIHTVVKSEFQMAQKKKKSNSSKKAANMKNVTKMGTGASLEFFELFIQFFCKVF